VLTLSAPNEYTGTTTISGSTLSLSNTAALSTTTGLTLAGGTLLRSTLHGAVVNAPITIGTAGSNVRISAPTNIPGDQTPTVLTLNGAIGGDGNVTFTSSANSNTVNTVLLNAQSTYAGSTLLDTSGTTATQTFVRLGTHNALPATTVVTIDGQAGTGSGRRIELDLNGFNQEIAGLTNVTRNLRIQRVVNSDAAPAATLTVNNGSDYTYSGRLGDGGANFGLTKSGAGIFTLTGSLSYAGDTTVTAGTLSLGSTNGGNNLSTMTVASGAKLKLTYAGTDTVAALVINDVPQAGGVYGHTDSGATNGGQGVGFFDTYFEAGSGTLTVPVGFASWIAGTFANGTVTNQGPDDDDDNDGISNLLEFAIAGQDPTVPNAAIGSFDGSKLSFTKRAGTSGLTYAIEESTDLGDTDGWQEVTGGSYTNNATTISYTLPGGQAKDFMRLKVSSN
jgi:autotransporter-associated beta strand protein